jgi:hypothetical protein
MGEVRERLAVSKQTTHRGRGTHIGYWFESQKERDHWEDQDVGGWTILKLILNKMGWYGLD